MTINPGRSDRPGDGPPENGSAARPARPPAPSAPDRAPEPAPAWLAARDPLLDSINVI
jgi:hypothetical protein